MGIRLLHRVLISATLLSAPLLAANCDSISGLQLPNTTITAAQTVSAGAFAPGVAPASAEAAGFKKLPAFCRVQGLIRPSSDSNIEFEVWMPASGWNGRYLAVGNGALAGSINYSGRAVAMRPTWSGG